MDYRKTLNLPQTDFSMKAGLATKEPAYLKQWADVGLYTAIKKKGAGKKKFVLHDGPPYANGHIHIGHALNKILKDMIVKFKTMEGYNTNYTPGWDCHGLPIEHKLFQEMNKRKEDVNSVDFRKQAHDYAMNFVNIQREEFKRLGVFGEWDKPYLTLDPNYEYWILKSLSELNKKGYIYRGLKPVNWDIENETALAEAEVEYENVTSPSVYVLFEATNPETLSLPTNKKCYLLVWTTTPWTLVANVAVSVHGAFKYSVVETQDKLIIVESSLRDKVLVKGELKDYNVIKEILGSSLTALKYDHPLGMRKNCPVVTADYVTKEDGTGLVHTAPGHGADDYQTGMKYKLDIVMPVNEKGIYTKDAGKYAGTHVWKANKIIIEDLQSAGILFKREDITHSYPHSWRSKKPIIFRATQQWFMKIDHNDLRTKAKEIIASEVKWVPPAGEERIKAMVAGRPDWCLSRQRYWGVPIPALKLKSTGEIKLYSAVIDHLADIVRKEGTDVWFIKDVQDLIPKGFKDPETGESEFEKTFDILDVWFDSGVSCQAVVKDMIKDDLPTDLYLEGSDQHRGWFQSSLIPAVAMEGKAPFKEVLTHGFVVDGAGRKMSKSLGNVMSPQEIYEENGADILRLWVASSSYNEDIRISKEVLDRLVDAYRKIRNTIRYLLSNLYDFQPDQEQLDYDDLMDLDKWALNKLSELSRSVREHYNAYEFSQVYKSIYSFCNEDLSNFYLDIIKDRLYVSAPKSKERKSAQTALFHILNYLVRLLAPVITFTSEEVFQFMPKDKSTKDMQSVHVLEFLDIPGPWKNLGIDGYFESMIMLRPYVLKALEEKRTAKEIGSPLEAKVIFKTASERDFTYLSQFGKRLAEIFIVSQAKVEKIDDVQAGLSEHFSKTQIVIEKADGEKCARCWKYNQDVGENKDHPTLCSDCASVVQKL
ncbi:MAG: isoleucine--tRNA ligase [Candidatus Omnitrophica bacterium]|nr:isoleucine--tRNA ligase [Candidatus Omnitrophota bacterium]